MSNTLSFILKISFIALLTYSCGKDSSKPTQNTEVKEAPITKKKDKVKEVHTTEKKKSKEVHTTNTKSKEVHTTNTKRKKTYTTEIPTLPKSTSQQIGAVDVLEDGRLVVAFHSGEISFYSPKTKQWHFYAQGLHEPLGITALSDKEIVVIQRAELTKVIDTDSDGIADLYKVITNDFGITGNYHEFNFGGVRDKDNNYYISLNVASNVAPIWKEIHGQWSTIGLERERFFSKDWKKIKGLAGRMYARVPYRGWVLKVSPKGKITPIASGFRSPNGIGIDDRGNVLVTDNQGDWLATSPIYHIKKGGFYGHPASLIWEKDWTGLDPLNIDGKVFDYMRTRPTAIFPQGEYANSPSQPLYIKDKRLGPFVGQWLVGSMSHNRILRFIPDMIGDAMQGTTLIHFDDEEIGKGNNRLVWGKDNDLWIGKIHLKWAGSYGLKRIKFNKQNQQTVKSVRLIDNGAFRLAFTQPIEIAPKHILIEEFSYSYWAKYGSPKINLKPIKIKNFKKINAHTYDVYTEKLKEKRYYEFKINSPNHKNKFVYTLNQFPNLYHREIHRPIPAELNREPKLKRWWFNKQKEIKRHSQKK